MKKKNKKSIKICIAQINYNSRDIQRHVTKIKNIIHNYKSYDLIVFPEVILHGHPSFERPEGFLYRKMKVIYSAISRDLYQFASQEKARVIIGEVKRWGERYFNVATYTDKDGTQSYTKTHVHWTENFVAGRKLVLFDSPFGKIGITICFDAAFSEVWRVLALKGAEVIVNISAVPKTFPVEYMWRRFVGAAIYNQVFVVYANRPGPFFSGHSAIFDPTGETVTKAGSKEMILEADIDIRKVKKWRDQEQIYPHRRPLLYREIANRHKQDFMAFAKEGPDQKFSRAS
ncbi:MAG: carbon-nitrogen hydrolase family protein [Thermodesulfobacteriota bacterium]|nr:carbon-nitrogen hydrolase family protein [Thermodesulfobacteriota bacterium]